MIITSFPACRTRRLLGRGIYASREGIGGTATTEYPSLPVPFLSPSAMRYFIVSFFPFLSILLFSR